MELALKMMVIREFDASKDCTGVEEVERKCEVGPSGKLCLFTDLLGDPVCRVRNSPAFLMLVAATPDDQNNHILGMIRGCIKTVTCGKKTPRSHKSSTFPHPLPVPVYTKLAYILGLRVSPTHRRMGIGLKLVNKMEEWFRENGAEYSYIATEKDNVASVHLFTQKCGYSNFRTPAILVNPVFAHRVPLSPRVTILPISRADADILYRRRFSTVEFFPRDIDAVLNNPLTLGTFLAVPHSAGYTWAGSDRFLVDPPESWAVLSVWNCNDVFRLQVRGVPRVKRGLIRTTRVLDRLFPWMKVPSVPELFRPFGLHLMYGLGGDGPEAGRMVRALCGYAHNLAKESGCAVVATEVSAGERLRGAIPHWKMLSCEEDLWCIKRLAEDFSDGSVGDWTKSTPGLSIFVDPREF